MDPNNILENQNEVLIKFKVPRKLKRDLITLARDRSIGLSALMRLMSTEYLKRNAIKA